MKTRLLYWWDVLRDQLWFIPSLWFVLALVVAFGTLRLDVWYPNLIDPPFFSIRTTSDSARVVLGSSIGALVTVLGLTFSVTMLSVSQTASQYGSRLVRLLFDSNVTQNTVGLFLCTIVYSMVILRSIRDGTLEEEGFIPQYSVLVAELACAACVMALLMFINQMTNCMRAETLIRSIYNDVLLAVESLFPESASVGREATTASNSEAEKIEDGPISEETQGIDLTSRRTGYLQAIDIENMSRVATAHDHQLRLLVKPGEFIHDGTRLAEVRKRGEDVSAEDAEEASGLNSAKSASTQKLEKKTAQGLYGSHFLTGTVRTPRQDIEAGLFEMVEAGVKALSPGINDPVTAINVIDHLTSLLRELAKRPWPERDIVDSEGKLRITVERVTYQHLLNASFGPLRQYAAGSILVYQRLLEALESIAEVAIRSEDNESISRQANLVIESASHTIKEREDLEYLKQLKSDLQLPS